MKGRLLSAIGSVLAGLAGRPKLLDGPNVVQRSKGPVTKGLGFPFHENRAGRTRIDERGRRTQMLAIKPSRSKYTPHQGKAEMARRART